jgi:hypothetical protein
MGQYPPGQAQKGADLPEIDFKAQEKRQVKIP